MRRFKLGRVLSFVSLLAALPAWAALSSVAAFTIIAASPARAALIDNPGDLYVSGQAGTTGIYEVNPTTGAIDGSVASNGSILQGLRFGSDGNLYAADNANDTLNEYNGQTGAAMGTVASGLVDPCGLVITNNLFYVSEKARKDVQAINSSGAVVYNISAPDFNNLPAGMAVGAGNQLMVGTRYGNSIDSFNLDGSSPSTFASNSSIGSSFGLAYGPNGNLYESNAGANSITELNGTTGAYLTSITGGGLNNPLGITFGPNGDLYAANSGNNTVSVFNGAGTPLNVISGFSGVYDVTFAAAPKVSAVAWGFNGSGQLGNGTTTNSSTPGAVSGLSSGVTAIAAGADHSLAVQNGGVLAWGYNAYGQLGNGTNTNSSTPVAVAGLSSGVTAIAAGQEHSLAVQNGGVLAWGYNAFGQLGNGTTTGSSTPVAVTGLSSGVTAIAAGTDHSLAIQNGGVWAWGNNDSGQLGNGTTTGSSTPVAVSGLSSGVTAIAAGDFHSLALNGGAVLAWGYNAFGQLGNGTTTNSSTPVAVTGLSSGVTAIAAGADHSLVVKNGSVWAWGRNANGQLGDGTTTSHLTPEQIDPTDLTNIIAVAAGDISSYALSSDGSIWDWGYNANGELGLGNTTGEYLTPQHLLPPSGYAYTSLDSDAEGVHVVAMLTAVPEPGCLSLLALGAVGLLVRRRRRSALARRFRNVSMNARFLPLFLLVGLAMQHVSATTILPTNYSFESPALAPNTYATNDTPTGWTINGDEFLINDANNSRIQSGKDGTQFLQFTVSNNGPNASAYQVLPNTMEYTIQPGTRYSLLTNIGISSTDAAAGFQSANIQTALYDATTATFLTYRNATAAEISGPGDDLAGTLTTFATPVFDSSVDSSHNGDQVEVILTAFAGPGNLEDIFDDVMISATPAPEPGCLSLLALGTACLLVRRRRRAAFVPHRECLDSPSYLESIMRKSNRVLAVILGVCLFSAASAHAALVGNPGDLYVSGEGGATGIYEVNPTTGAIVGSVPSNGSDLLGMRFGSDGNLYAVDYNNHTLNEYNGATGAPIGTVATGLSDAYGLAIANNLFYVSESLGAEDVRAFNSSGTAVYTITSSDFSNLPLGMVVSPSNQLLVGTRNGTSIDSFNLDGSSPSTFASNSAIGFGFGLAYGPNGNLYESNAGTNSILEFNGTTGAYITSITGGGLDGPLGIAFGPNGDLYAANGDGGDNTISVFDASGDPITTFSGFGGVYDVTFNPSGVPEPACLSALLLGAAGLLARRRSARA